MNVAMLILLILFFVILGIHVWIELFYFDGIRYFLGKTVCQCKHGVDIRSFYPCVECKKDNEI